MIGFALAIAMSICSYLMGMIGDIFDVKDNPKTLGTLLGITAMSSYFISFPLFAVAACIYAKKYLWFNWY